MNTDTAVAAFCEALRAHGIVPPEHIEADGQLHRCDVDARNGNGDAAYVLHLDGLPAGGFQNWQTGSGWQDWCAKESRTLTEQERRQYRARVEQAKQLRQADTVRRRAQTR